MVVLSGSDSELLSGENILFFFRVSFCEFFELVVAFGGTLALLSEAGVRGAGLPCLVATVAVAFGFADERLRGGAVLAGTGLGASSSLEDRILLTTDDDDRLPFFR